MKKPARKSGKTRGVALKSSNAWDIEDRALKDFERALGFLHRRNYSEALERFQGIARSHPREKELVDRANIYIRVCRGQLDKNAVQPRKPHELFYHGVMRANEADYDGAVGFLGKALQGNPRDEKVLYVMASTLALKGERQEALKHLHEAVELNPINRIYARNDPDFEPLRDDEAFQDLIYPEEV
ncbi:MAG: tetratricopeptide repeat protein [Acidobacteriota bacterium]